jgi:SAM-dependent methyltransferase
VTRQADDQMPAYSEAVQSGLYAKTSGLTGKYDNVRRLWEDEITRGCLRPFLQRLMQQRRNAMRRLRILDLGCGSGDGYELLTGIRDRDANLEQTEVDLITPESLELYKGIDLNADLLQQAATVHGHNPKMVFAQGSFTDGLPLEDPAEAYDLYFTSFGTCSHHNDDETMIRMLEDIAARTRDNALVHCDWLGRYSYEWQTLWTHDPDTARNMDYVVSYIYNTAEREARRDALQHLTLRLMSRPEIEAIVDAASRRSGVPIRILKVYDRSVFTGRHIDTGEYNAGPQPMRSAVNALHESNLRTDLNSLLFDYVPRQGFDFLNRFYEDLQASWNCLVHHTGALLAAYDETARRYAGPLPAVPAACPEPTRAMLKRMTRIVEGTGWYGMGLPRENIIEPQLGYALRHIVTALQQGRGCGHGLVAILEIDRTAGAQ